MTRKAIWTLTVSYWGKLPEGVRPNRVAGYAMLDEAKPGNYKPHDFQFDNPPTRQDFLNLTRYYGWMSVWDKDVFPAVARSQFPLIDMAHKGSQADLLDECGNVVGRLEVWREYLHQNPVASIPFIGVDNEHAVLRHLPKEKRDEADMIVMQNSNRIRERLMAFTEGFTDQQVQREVRRVLEEANLVKPKPAKSKALKTPA